MLRTRPHSVGSLYEPLLGRQYSPLWRSSQSVQSGWCGAAVEARAVAGYWHVLVLPVLVGASLPSPLHHRVVGVAPASHTLSGAEAVAERRRGRCSPGRSDMTHEEKAECELRASLVLRDLKALEHRCLLGENVKIKILKPSGNQVISLHAYDVTSY